MNKKFDIIVVGAGLGGLASAFELARAGKKVVILERHNLPGGYASSFVRGRFEFEPSLHEMPDMRSIKDVTGVVRYLLDDAKLDISFKSIPEAYRLILTEKKESTQKNLSVFLKSYTKKDALVIVLDKITDPHNYGAILRSADQFYADLIIIPGRQSAQDSPTVLKTSAGASNYVPVVIHNIASAISMLKENGFWIFGAGLDGDRIDKKDFKGRVAVVLGSEGKGISSLVKKSCDTLISIPTSGNIDSLNVSVAAGIIMYEVRKQQTDKIV